MTGDERYQRQARLHRKNNELHNDKTHFHSSTLLVSRHISCQTRHCYWQLMMVFLGCFLLHCEHRLKSSDEHTSAATTSGDYQQNRSLLPSHLLTLSVQYNYWPCSRYSTSVTHASLLHIKLHRPMKWGQINCVWRHAIHPKHNHATLLSNLLTAI